MSVAVLMEVRPRLKSCNVALTINSQSKVRCKVQKNQLKINNTTFLFSNLEFEPLTISRIHSVNNFVEFHVQLRTFQLSSNLRWRLTSYIPPDKEITFSCLCGTALSLAVSFKRVLPLPSSNWEEADAFCHGKAEAPIEMKTSDCLYGTHFIHVSEKIFNFPENVPRCSTCLTLIGKRIDGCYKLWTSNLLLTPSVDPLDDFISIIMDIVSDPLAILSKLLLEVEQKPRYLTIWVLEKDLKIYRGQRASIDEVNISEETVMKVQYCYHSCRNQEVVDWSNDNRVHCIPVPDRLLVAAHQFLIKSNSQLPPSFSKSNGKTMAYVPCFFKK